MYADTATERGKYSRECAAAECEQHSKDTDFRSRAAGPRGQKPSEASGPEQVGVKPQMEMEMCDFTSSVLLLTPESRYMKQCPSDLHLQINLKP